MSSGAVVITPGYQFNAEGGELVDLYKLNWLGFPWARVAEGAIGRRELQSSFLEQIDGYRASIEDETNLRVAADVALASRVTTLEVEVLGSSGVDFLALLTAEQTVRATADSALASRATTLEAQMAGTATSVLNSRIVDEATVRAAADTAEATARTAADATLQSGLDTLSASVSSEISVRTTADAALATRANNLEAQMAGTLTSWLKTKITDVESGYATADAALASRTTTLESQAAGTAPSYLLTAIAGIQSDYSTQAYADGRALARKSEAITAAATDAQARVDILASATADKFGNLGSVVAFKATAGNVVTGLRIHSSTGGPVDISEIVFQADNFKFLTGSGTFTPFAISGGVSTFLGEVDVGTDTVATTRLQIRPTGISFGSFKVTRPSGSFTPSITEFTGSGGSKMAFTAGGLFTPIFSIYDSGGALSGQILADGTAALKKITVTDTAQISFRNDDNRIYENYGIVMRGQGALWPVRIINTALVLGDVGYGSSFTAGQVHDKNGDRILRERYSGTPTTLSDVISILQYHGLSN